MGSGRGVGSSAYDRLEHTIRRPASSSCSPAWVSALRVLATYFVQMEKNIPESAILSIVSVKLPLEIKCIEKLNNLRMEKRKFRKKVRCGVKGMNSIM